MRGHDEGSADERPVAKKNDSSRQGATEPKADEKGGWSLRQTEVVRGAEDGNRLCSVFVRASRQASSSAASSLFPASRLCLPASCVVLAIREDQTGSLHAGQVGSARTRKSARERRQAAQKRAVQERPPGHPKRKPRMPRGNISGDGQLFLQPSYAQSACRATRAGSKQKDKTTDGGGGGPASEVRGQDRQNGQMRTTVDDADKCTNA